MTQNETGCFKVPSHVAMIMDGNRRWAAQRGKTAEEGHWAGVENIRSIIEHFAEREVKYLTFFAFSTENRNRSRFEVEVLMKIMLRVLDREIKPLHEAGAKLLHIGSKEGLSPAIVKRIEEAEYLTRNNEVITVMPAFDYGGRAEIVQAVNRIIKDGMEGEITEEMLSNNLYTATIPDPDVIIRTGKEKRLSNFLPWQSVYSELIFLDKYWPDFNTEDIDFVLSEYKKRNRRFGGDTS